MMDTQLLKHFLDLFLTFLAIAILAVLVFTLPSLLIWNIIISPKFDLPTFNFWEMFSAMVFIRIVIPTNTTKVK